MDKSTGYSFSQESNTPDKKDYTTASPVTELSYIPSSASPATGAWKTYVAAQRNEGEAVKVVINFDSLREKEIRDRIREILGE